MLSKSKFDSDCLEDWLNYYTTLHFVGVDLGLCRIQAVFNRLSITRLASHKTITVSGTNGKGSSCKMLSLILSKQGFKVGVFSSPHLFEFNERISINDCPVANDEIIAAFRQIEIARQNIELTYFEVAALACFIIFKKHAVDFAILEVGLGGRLDAVNVIDADAAIITSIALDHQAYLGNDLCEIVMEKAGVFRGKAPAVCADQVIYPNLVQHCVEKEIPLTYCNKDFYYNTEGHITLCDRELQLPQTIVNQGSQQIQNAAGVFELLNRIGYLPKNAETILADFQLLGRLTFLSYAPDIIVDVAHNPAAAFYLSEFLKQKKSNYRKIKVIVGMLSDKDVSGVLSLFTQIVDQFFLTSTKGERGLTSDDLANELREIDKDNSVCYQTYESVSLALTAALDCLDNKDLLVCFGSFLVAGDVMAILKKRMASDGSI